MPKRPCIECGTPTLNTTRCTPCGRAHMRGKSKARGRRPEYAGNWQYQSKQLRLQWIIHNGHYCPGWRLPNYPGHSPHPATDLVVDHDLGILCRSCNSSKAATHDRDRAKANRKKNNEEPRTTNEK